MPSPFSAPSMPRLLLLVTLLSVPGLAQLPERLVLHGSGPNQDFGYAVAALGDINGDGDDDFLIGARVEFGGGAASGTARAISGRDGSTLHLLLGAGVGDEFGSSVANAGDVNGDGIDDLIVGAPLDTDGGAAGRAYVFSGADGSTLHTVTRFAFEDAVFFGRSVGGCGDVNGDGFEDFVVGDPNWGFSPFDVGSAHVYSGLDGSVLHALFGAAAGDFFGTAVCGVGDIDGDGRGDLLIGSPGNDTLGPNGGRVRAYSGATGAVIHTLHGAAGDSLGQSLAAAGDANFDGAPDIIMGSPGSDLNGIDSGLVRVLSLNPPAVIATFLGDTTGDRLGTEVAGLGDANGDGFRDFAASAPFADPNGSNSGLVRAYSGIDDSVLAEFAGDSTLDLFGFALAGIGDTNGDGLPELLVGSWRNGVNGAFSGSAWVYSIGGERRYGVGADPAQTLNLGWSSFGLVTGASAGEMEITGAAAFATGALGFSIGEAQATFLGTTLLIDANPGNFQTFGVAFDASGSFRVPIDLRQPALDGVSLFFQAAENNAAGPMGIFSSNGLEIRFTR